MKRTILSAAMAMTVVLLLSVSMASATIIFDVDNSDQLSGTFILDVETFLNISAPVASFDHFRESGDAGRGSLVVGATISTVAPLFITGENEVPNLFYGTEQFITLMTSFPDRSGTYISPFDGRLVEYRYTNLSFGPFQPEFSGDFSFQVIPEPSSVTLLGLGLALMGISRNRRHRRPRLH
jgi:hypothetical protein